MGRTISPEQLRPRVSRTQALHKPKPKVVAPPAPPEVKVETAAPVIHIDMSKFTEDNTAVLKEISEAVKAQQPAARVTEWTFDFERDERGFVKRVIAKAK